jgi:glycerol-3-phosphate O-acyltransferase / dihydroxyacetone phosphate acyltransferase
MHAANEMPVAPAAGKASRLGSLIYRAGRLLLRTALGFYFRRRVFFHAERVPLRGPVLFTSNHPNSLTDAFVIGASVPRKVHFMATVQLFQWGPLRWLLLQAGVIPLNRVKDDPRAMRTVIASFAAAHRVLEQGEAVAIFPEGITHDDPQLKSVKSGAARMALDLEHQHEGKLGLKIVPVGLTFSAKEHYRSQVLVSFGEPILISDYLLDYATRRHERLQELTAEIERRIQSLMYHLPHLEQARMIAAVKSLYLDKLWVANRMIHEPVAPAAGELLLTKAIAAAVERSFQQNPARAAEFSRKLDHYEHLLHKLQLPEEILVHFPESGWMLRRSLAWCALGILGLPVAIYGWLHRLLPWLVLRAIIKRTAKQPADNTNVSTAAMIGGGIVFAAFYGICAGLCAHLFGWRVAAWYALSLPPAGLIAHYYWLGLCRFLASLRAAAVLLRTPTTARRLLQLRAELIEMIDLQRSELIRADSERPLAASSTTP